MAIDKAVDSAALDAGLKQIADAIRAKGGTSAQLAFPAAMAEAVAAIQSGGGEFAVASGTITYAEQINLYSDPITIEHGLSKTPCVFLAVHGATGSRVKGDLCYAVYANYNFGEMRSSYTGIMYAASAGSEAVAENFRSNGVSATQKSVTIGTNRAGVTVGGTTSLGFAYTLTWVALARN